MNLEMAYSLALKGKKVIISSRRGLRQGLMDLGDDNSSPQQQRLSILLSSMRDRISFIYGHGIAEVTETGAVLRSVQNRDNTREVACDNVIMCRGYHGQPKLFTELRDKDQNVYLVGDAVLKLRCDDKRVIGNAITDAWGIANMI